jgi:hypothetical protein
MIMTTTGIPEGQQRNCTMLFQQSVLLHGTATV